MSAPKFFRLSSLCLYTKYLPVQINETA